MNVKTTVTALNTPRKDLGTMRERNVRVVVDVTDVQRGEAIVDALQHAFRGALDVVEAAVKAR